MNVFGERYVPVDSVEAPDGELIDAIDSFHARPVALLVRTVSPAAGRDELVAQTRALMSLPPHPSVSTVRDAFFADGRYVMVMDRPEGQTLAGVLAECGDTGLPVSAVLGYLEQLAAAVDHLHRQRPPVVHGDVRPERVLVTAGDAVVLMFAGTGSAAETADDIAGFGATAVQLLTGSRPGTGEDARSDAPLWESVDPEAAKHLSRILRRALDSDVSRRPGSAAVIVERLRAWHAADLPAGAVTFLLTDIEGSTDLWEAHPAVMSSVIARHNDIVADCVDACDGRQPRSQGEGDSTLSAFAHPAAAVRAVLAVQRALAEEPWPEGIALRVRAGLHTGEAEVRAGDYLGASVSRAARIRALARGGQVLLSQTTAQLVIDRLPAGAELCHLGRRALKGLAREEDVFQIRAAGLVDAPLPAVGTASRSADTSYVARALPIVGRAAERDAMTAAYASVATGQSRVLLITGEAGIGKTRLIEELIQQVGSAGAGAQVRIGESAPLAGAALAYGPFIAALGDRAAWLLAASEPGDMVAARHRLFERVLALLADLAVEAPMVLVLEDLHWADESSHELLAFLAVRLRDLPVLVVATLRDEELADGARRWLSDLERRPRVTRLRLAGLAPAEVAELVADLVPEDSGPDPVAAVIRAADGNPLYALELAATGARFPPASLTEAVLAKATGVAPAVRALVDQVCVADGGMSHELLAATLQLSEDDLLAAAREAVSRRLLVATADGYVFPHNLIRHVFYSQLLPGERHRLHRHVAEALSAQLEPDPALLSLHWQLADCPDRAAPAALLAARQAVSARAYPEADHFYTLAVEQARWLPEPGPGLLEEAARAASWAGHPERAAGYAADALGQLGAAGPADRARLLERLGRYRWEQGDPRAAVEATGQAWELLQADPPSDLQARILAALATWRMFLGELDEAMPLALKAVAMAKQVGADAEQAHGLAALGIIQAQRGELDAGLAALHSSFTLACRVGSIEGVIRAAANHMYLLITVGRFTEALDVGRSGQRAARSLHAPPALMWVLDNNTAAVLTATGRWVEADQLLAELVVESQANATRYLQLLQLELAVGRGERDRADELAMALKKPPEDPRLLGPLHSCLAEQALNAGDLATAADEVLDGLAALKGAALAEEEIRLLAAGARVSADLASLPSTARPGNIAASWEPAAASLAGRAQAIIDEHGGRQPVVAAFGALVAAEIARQRGSDDQATWQSVADAWKLLAQPYKEAYARLHEAGAAVRAGRREQAARALAACESLASHLPAAPLLTLASELGRRASLTSQAVSPAGPTAARSGST